MTQTGDQVILEFSKAILVKTMDGAVDKTQWRQAGNVTVENAEIEGELSATACVVETADLIDNSYIYRDMVQLPFRTKGSVGFEVKFKGSNATLVVMGEQIELTLYDIPKYIKHIAGD